MPQYSDFGKGPDPHPCSSNDPITWNLSDAWIAAVRTVISIISKDKVFIFSQSNRICCQAGIFHHFTTIGFLQCFPINIDCSINNLHGLTGKSDNSFDKIRIFFCGDRDMGTS